MPRASSTSSPTRALLGNRDPTTKSENGAVRGRLNALTEHALLGWVGDEERLRGRGAERSFRLVEQEMLARLVLDLFERRLAEEEIAVPRELDELVAGRRVAGVGEHGVAVRDAEAVRAHEVVPHADRKHLEARDLARD